MPEPSDLVHSWLAPQRSLSFRDHSRRRHVDDDTTSKIVCGGSIKQIGKLSCNLTYRDISISTTAGSQLNLLCFGWSGQLDLLDLPINPICYGVHSAKPTASLTAQMMVKRFSKVLQEDFGLCNHTKVTLNLMPNVQPIFHPMHPVPLAAVPMMDGKLKFLAKKRRCKTCVSFKMEPNCYPPQVPDDIVSIANGDKCFAKFDSAEVYLKIEFAPESQELLSINTRRGLYKCTRLLFCVKAALVIFHQIMDSMISGLTVTAIVDRSQQELQERATAPLPRIQYYGFCFGAEHSMYL
ncbi:unnamed protein product [Hymenolepis diminuta]|uniref:C2 domain-containing protein n=1 Tax=Hymenolepis diminuta TaxID=6216 RepID=A0A0R3SSA9_HYMDI|nr:unnamed protein product [Hymenolepis diminuta]